MTNKKLDSATMDARAKVLEACAEYLNTVAWAEDERDQSQKAGDWIAVRLRAEARHWRLRATNDRERGARLSRRLLALATTKQITP